MHKEKKFDEQKVQSSLAFEDGARPKPAIISSS
jgi:hypothetical protein